MDTSTYPAGDMARYVAVCRRSQQQLAAHHACLARQARAEASRLADHLRQQYSMHRVILFGSLVRGGFVEGSDWRTRRLHLTLNLGCVDCVDCP